MLKLKSSILVLLIVLLATAGAWAQTTDPRTQPLTQASDITYLGKISVPAEFEYGMSAMGMAADGVSMWVACRPQGRIARISIPAIGGTATLLEPCQEIPNYVVAPVDTSGVYIGGLLAWQGQLCASAWAYYDGSHAQTASHWCGPTIATMKGPFKVGAEKPGLVGGAMGVIPPEWVQTLGGPAITGQCCIPIIGRSSFGTDIHVFDPMKVSGPTSTVVPAKAVVSFPQGHENRLVGFYQEGDGGPVYSQSTQPGGFAFPVGSRSVLWVGRQPADVKKTCYGQGTTDPTLHLKDLPGTNGAVHYCYDPWDSGKGTHGYPYRTGVAAWDAAQMVSGKLPWDQVPYGDWTIDADTSSQVASVTFDPVKGRLYVARGGWAGPWPTLPAIKVYQIGAGGVAPPPPPPPPIDKDCVETVGLWGPGPQPDGWSGWTVLGTVETRYRDRGWTQTQAKQGAGAACTFTAAQSPATEHVAESRPWTPPPTPQFVGRFRAQSVVTAGLRLTLQVAAGTPLPAVGTTVQVLVDGVPIASTIYDIDLGYYAGTPKDTRVIVTVPGLTYFTFTVKQ